MSKKKTDTITEAQFNSFVPGGQTIGQEPEGRKVFAWGVLPGETARVRVTKRKANYWEGIVSEVISASEQRVAPKDPASYLSTSPWQILNEAEEDGSKQALVREVFTQHGVELPALELHPTAQWYHYRNKTEFSWYWDKATEQLDLAFFARGTHSKIPVDGTSLAMPSINNTALAVREMLRRNGCEARSLKTLMLRCDQAGNVNAQLYVKDEDFARLSVQDIESFGIHGFQVIYSDPRSPASKFTKLLLEYGENYLQDTLLARTFRYATEGFFQVNLPVYEAALSDIQAHILPSAPVVDLYSGVGTIGLTVGGSSPLLIEQDTSCVREMQRNVRETGSGAHVVHASAEQSLDYLAHDQCVIIDPPRAGLHADVTASLLDVAPPRIIYLSCNPATQARDVALLSETYDITLAKMYNFFPRTPHIENLIVLDRR